ncbi:MAG: hypothetical protein V1894_01075 [Chloroflexota bacterium]
MKFLKRLLVGFLSLILFLCLPLYALAYTLDRTILSADFVATEIGKLDVAQLGLEIIRTQLPATQNISASTPLGNMNIPISRDLIAEASYQALTRLEPQLKEQASQAIHSGYDYLLGKTSRLSMVINLEPIKANLKDNLRQSIVDALEKSPPVVPGVPAATLQQVLDQYFNQSYDQFYQGFAKSIPSSYVIDESKIPPDAQSLLSQVKLYLGYYTTYSKWLLPAMAVLVLLIILIERSFKGISRSLGLELLLYGGFGLAVDFAAQKYTPSIPMPPEIPPSLTNWLIGLTNDIATPLKTLSIVMAIIGAMLFIASFFLPRPKEVEAEPTQEQTKASLQ